MLRSYGLYLPLPIVAALLAFIYGQSIKHAWVSMVLTFCLAMLGGLVYGAIGQIVGVALSAIIIFFAFALPEQRRQANEEAKRAKDAEQLPNEEDR